MKLEKRKREEKEGKEGKEKKEKGKERYGRDHSLCVISTCV